MASCTGARGANDELHLGVVGWLFNALFTVQPFARDQLGDIM